MWWVEEGGVVHTPEWVTVGVITQLGVRVVTLNVLYGDILLV